MHAEQEKGVLFDCFGDELEATAMVTVILLEYIAVSARMLGKEAVQELLE